MVTKLLNRLGRKVRLSVNLKGSWIALRKEVLQELNTVLPLPCFQTWLALLLFSLSCSLMVQDPKLHVSNVWPSIYLMRSQQDQVLMVDNSRENAVLGVGSRSETICFIDLWFLVEVIGWRWLWLELCSVQMARSLSVWQEIKEAMSYFLKRWNATIIINMLRH